MNNFYNNFLEIIGSFVDAYTVCFFEIKGNILKLKEFFTLSNHLNKDKEIKIGESILGWIAKHKKPVNIKGDTLSHKILDIYNKHEEIKTYYVVPVGNKGVLYIDSKRSYSITEKQQKLLNYCAKFYLKLLEFDTKFQDFKNILKNREFLKKFDYKDFFDYTCKFFKFESGIICRKEGDNFLIIAASDNNLINRKISLDNKIGILLHKNIDKVTFVEHIHNSLNFIDNQKIENFTIIPVLSKGITIGAIIFFNLKNKNQTLVNKNIEELKKIFELKFYEEVFKYEAFKKLDKIISIENFLLNSKKFKDKSFIYLKIIAYYKLISSFSEKQILRSFMNIINTIEKAFNAEFEIIKITPNSYALVVEKQLLEKIKNFIEKNFKNSYLKINNQLVNVKFNIKSCDNLHDFYKTIFN